MKEEPKLKNICIKCGVDLYSTEGRFECQKHPKECKGIILPKETLQEWADKEEQKQHIIGIMEKDEELGLYDIFNDEKRQGVKELIDKHTLEEASWKFNPLKKLDGEFLRHAFKEGAKWQAERSYSEEEVKKLAFDFYYDMSHKMGVPTNLISENATNVDVWFKQFKNK